MKTTSSISPLSGNVNPVRQRLAGLSALLAFTALGLAACGGGGGGGGETAGPAPSPAPSPAPAPAPAPAPSPAPAPAPAPTPSGGIDAVLQCKIPDKQANCDLIVAYTANNTVNAKVKSNIPGAASVPVTNGTGVTITIPVTGEGNWTVMLENGDGTQLGTPQTGASACDTGAMWDEEVDKKCRKPHYYGPTTLAIWDRNGRFYYVTPAGLTAFGEETPWNLGVASDFLYFGGFKRVKPIDKFGRVEVVMQTNPDFTPRKFYLDLATMKVVGDGSVAVNRDDYEFGWQTTAEHPDWVAEARNGNAWYYVDVSGAGTLAYREHLWYWQDGAASIEVTSWTNEQFGNLRRLQTFSNPQP